MSMFTDRLEQELLDAGRRRRQTAAGPRSFVAVHRSRLAASAAALTVVGVALYLALGTSSGSNSTVPVMNFSGAGQNVSFAYPDPGENRFVGNQGCIKEIDEAHLPALVHSTSTPSPDLVSELSLLRVPRTPIDMTSLGRWDRDLPPILTVFNRYERVFNASHGVKVAFIPVAYCNETQVSGPSEPSSAPLGSTTTTGNEIRVFRVTLEQGIVMLVLSNPGVHPPVLVGTATQIRQGPGLAGLDIDNEHDFGIGWLQTTIVPDGVSRVVMKFTPPFLHHYSNSVAIHDNVGIVVRRPDYTPTTVLWYGPNGKLIKKFVDRQTLAYENCLHAHDCPKGQPPGS